MQYYFLEGLCIMENIIKDFIEKITSESSNLLDKLKQINKISLKKGKKFDNGFLVTGTWKNGIVNGKCKLVDDSGNLVFEGMVKDNKAEGFGIIYSDDSIIYKGGFIEGKKDGEGVFYWPDGSYYKGEWKDDKRNGIGKFIAVDNSSYEGEWLNGLPSGEGEYIVKDKYSYTGEFLGGFFEGKGKIEYFDGSIYEGDFKKGLPDGYGVKKCSNNSSYEGNWSNGQENGLGIKRYMDGSIYEGEFIDGKKEGKGKLTFNNGTVYEGMFIDDKLDSKGLLLYPDGDEYRGQLVDNKPEGLGHLEYKYGPVFIGQFCGGIKKGKGKIFYNNDNINIGFWDNDKRNGWGANYNASKLTIGTYKDNELVEEIKLNKRVNLDMHFWRFLTKVFFNFSSSTSFFKLFNIEYVENSITLEKEILLYESVVLDRVLGIEVDSTGDGTDKSGINQSGFIKGNLLRVVNLGTTIESIIQYIELEGLLRAEQISTNQGNIIDKISQIKNIGKIVLKGQDQEENLFIIQDSEIKSKSTSNNGNNDMLIFIKNPKICYTLLKIKDIDESLYEKDIINLARQGLILTIDVENMTVRLIRQEDIEEIVEVDNTGIADLSKNFILNEVSSILEEAAATLEMNGSMITDENLSKGILFLVSLIVNNSTNKVIGYVFIDELSNLKILDRKEALKYVNSNNVLLENVDLRMRNGKQFIVGKNMNLNKDVVAIKIKNSFAHKKNFIDILYSILGRTEESFNSSILREEFFIKNGNKFQLTRD